MVRYVKIGWHAVVVTPLLLVATFISRQRALRALLAVVFYGVLCPIALLTRLFGKPDAAMGAKRSGGWRDVGITSCDKEQYRSAL